SRRTTTLWTAMRTTGARIAIRIDQESAAKRSTRQPPQEAMYGGVISRGLPRTAAPLAHHWLSPLRHPDHHQWRLEDDAELGAEERAESLERRGVGQIVEQLDPHVVGERPLGLVELPRVLQRRGELGNLAALRDRAGVAEGDLGEPGDPRLDVAHPLLEKWDGIREILQPLRSLRAWPDQAHLSPQHVPELGQFVEPRLAEELADPGDADVVGACDHDAGLGLGIGHHRAELVHLEFVELKLLLAVLG